MRLNMYNKSRAEKAKVEHINFALTDFDDPLVLYHILSSNM